MRNKTRTQSSLLNPRVCAAVVLCSCLTVLALAARPANSAQPGDPAIQTVAPTFTVNSPADIVAAAPLDSGPCETATGNNVCTLRAAIMKANHFPGGGATIKFGLPGVVTYFLTIPKSGADDESTGDLNITNSLSIIGNGAGNTIIDGNGSVMNDHVFGINTLVTATISGVTIQNANSLNIGGGIINGGTLTLDNCAIINNSVAGLNAWGGGIFNSGTLTVTHSVVSGNITGSSNSYAGGIFNQGPLQVINSTISDNTTTGINALGGGIYNVGYAAIVIDSTISGNTAQNGGGIYKTGSPLTVINSTISGNFSNVNGAGIYASSGTTGLFNVTIALNRANADGIGGGTGGGIFNASGSTLNFVNSIIALNETVIDMSPFDLLDNNECSGTLASQGNNLMFLNDPAHCTVNGTVVYADPNLGPLQNNGGPTPTHALLTGSPAIDGGNSGGCTDNLGAPLTTDQRGAPRPFPVGGHCDLGAFELAPLATLDLDGSNTATKYDALTDGLLAIRYMFGLTGSALTAGALGGTATRTDPAAIKAYLDSIRTSLDVDGNGTADALTDGLMLIRYLFGLRGPSLISGAIGTGATRTTAQDIETFIQSLMP